MRSDLAQSSAEGTLNGASPLRETPAHKPCTLSDHAGAKLVSAIRAAMKNAPAADRIVNFRSTTPAPTSITNIFYRPTTYPSCAMICLQVPAQDMGLQAKTTTSYKCFQKMTARVEADMVRATLDIVDGIAGFCASFYLRDRPYPTRDQLLNCHLCAPEFVAAKRALDPDAALIRDLPPGRCILSRNVCSVTLSGEAADFTQSLSYEGAKPGLPTGLLGRAPLTS